MPPAILAEFVPLSPASQWAIVSLLSVALILISIWAILRRKPPLGEDLVKLNATISSLEKAVEKLTKTQETYTTHATEIATLKIKVADLETKREEDNKAQRTYTRETTREIFVAIEKLKDSFNANIQAVERTLGKLEGAMEAFDGRINRLEVKEP